MKLTILDTERTNNFNDADIQGKMAALWQHNMLAVKKASHEGLTVACVYYKYESNYQGDYSVALCKEDSNNGVFDTANNSWKEYPVDSNDKLGVIHTWQKIWSDEDEHKIDRVYTFDFEQYLPNGAISILVAIG